MFALLFIVILCSNIGLLPVTHFTNIKNNNMVRNSTKSCCRKRNLILDIIIKVGKFANLIFSNCFQKSALLVIKSS